MFVGTSRGSEWFVGSVWTSGSRVSELAGFGVCPRGNLSHFSRFLKVYLCSTLNLEHIGRKMGQKG